MRTASSTRALSGVGAALVLALSSTALTDPAFGFEQFTPNRASEGDLVQLEYSPFHLFQKRARLYLAQLDPASGELIRRRGRVRVRSSETGRVQFKVRRAPPGSYGLILKRRGSADALIRGDFAIGGPDLGQLPSEARRAGEIVLLPGTFNKRRGLRVFVGGTRARVVSKERDAISFRVPEGLVPGEHDVIVRGRTGSSVAETALLVDGPTVPPAAPETGTGFEGSWVPDGVNPDVLTIDLRRDGSARIESATHVETNRTRLPQIDMRFPAAELDSEAGSRSFPVTALVVRRSRQFAIGPNSSAIETWVAEEGVTARVVSRVDNGASRHVELRISGVLHPVGTDGAPRADAPIEIVDGRVRAEFIDREEPLTSARIELEFIAGDGFADSEHSSGSYGVAVPGAASPTSPPLLESTVVTRFIDLGVANAERYISAVDTELLRTRERHAALVEVQFTKQRFPENVVVGPEPDLSAIGVELLTQDPSVTTAWLPLAVRDEHPATIGVFQFIPQGTDTFELPDEQLEAGDYRFARFRVRFVLDPDFDPATDSLPFVDAVALGFQYRGQPD